MRTLWILIFAVFIGAITTMFLSDDESSVSMTSTPSTPTTAALPAEAVSDVSPGTPDGDTATNDPVESLVEDLMDSATMVESTSQPTATPAAGDSDEQSSQDTGETLTLGMDRVIASATIVEGDIRRVTPDELKVDGEFTLQGEGTKENPYRPSWEYLYSAGDTYAPRLGQNEIPQRIALLDGAWVDISGYTVFPLVSGKTTELLIMLNQWDGCCIGVPPTPFDAIEVGLNEAVMRGPKHAISFGSITGRLKVDPYLIEDWLVGLYLLEEGTLQPGL